MLGPQASPPAGYEHELEIARAGGDACGPRNTVPGIKYEDCFDWKRCDGPAGGVEG